MHGLDDRRINQRVTDIRLICNHYYYKPRIFQRADGSSGAGQKPKIRKGARRVGLAARDRAAIDDAVPVKKYSPAQSVRSGAAVKGHACGRCYHLVAFCCSFGWETRQCQTTA